MPKHPYGLLIIAVDSQHSTPVLLWATPALLRPTNCLAAASATVHCRKVGRLWSAFASVGRGPPVPYGKPLTEQHVHGEKRDVIDRSPRGICQMSVEK